MAWNLSFNIGNLAREPVKIEQNNNGSFFYTMFSSNGNNKRFPSEQDKIRTILNSPACLKVFAINCDLFSLGRINSENENEYLKTLKKKPNFKQGWTQFYWDYMFWSMTGTAYLWKNGGQLLNDSTTLQWLNPANLVWDSTIVDKLKDLIFTKSTYKEVLGQNVKYQLGNGKSRYIPLNEITPLFDLSNGMNDNFYQGVSRVDALFKVICNSEESLDAKNINLEFTRKFIVTGTQDPNNTSQLPMGEKEKQSVEDKMRGNEYSIHAMKSQIDIKHFVDNMANLKLDDAYSADYYTIGSMFGIPRDILETYNSKGSTYENQEKSIVRHIEYVMKPKGENLTDALENILSIDDIEMSWEHLACYQVFQKESQEVIKLKLENSILAKTNGIKIQDI